MKKKIYKTVIYLAVISLINWLLWCIIMGEPAGWVLVGRIIGTILGLLVAEAFISGGCILLRRIRKCKDKRSED